ncbi:DUF6457 domain-containing protein [Georgenia sp. MJ206]|uniref:DUF6457 domain-containing protein n=1 Tax=Georgenia wangjunii TaxID=3117730 RepID=UPI002F261433
MNGEREKMAAMNVWLDAVCRELDVDRAVMTEVTGPLLALIRDVAHGPTRPGAPLTAFLVGLASARAAGPDPAAQAAAVEARVAAVARLVADYPGEPA